MEIKVYKKGKVTKTVEGNAEEMSFGAVRKLMKLLKIDKTKDTAELMTIISDAWDELIKLLDEIFPDMTEEDWDNTKLSEVGAVILDILKSSFTQIIALPKSEKN